MSIYNQFTYKQIYVNKYCLLVATLARYFHSFGWLTGFYASKTRLKRNVSYRHLIKLECYKLSKHMLGIEEYKPFKAWW